MSVLGETGLTELITLIKNKLAGYLSTSGGTVSGNLTVTGTITGDVTGDVTGNASTATTATSATSADSATKATQDGSGNVITSTYLPLAGGTLTGTTLAGTDNIISRSVDNAMVYIGGASTWQNGAYIELMGKDKSSNPGAFHVRTTDGANNPSLWAYPDGRFTWNGANVLTDATVGTVVSNSNSSDVSVPQNTTTKITSVTLSAGTWVVTGHLQYTSVVTRQFASLNDSGTLNAGVEGTAVHYAGTSSSTTLALCVTRIFVLNASTEIRLNGFASVACTAGTSHITAVRIV